MWPRKQSENPSLEKEGEEYCNAKVLVSGLLPTNLKWDAARGVD